MTQSKIIFIIFISALFLISLALFRKTSTEKNKHTFFSFFYSALLGIIGLLLINALSIFNINLLPINLCTTLASAFGSIPALISMLFLNIF
ncbi:MAG: pro-sigmaK processing inhibitor BofA family protein [Oscillospiraceae bacterium]|nr:pro-sigmaK processing inhibitor BofA family protein [Oscillospiraceae bacterium]